MKTLPIRWAFFVISVMTGILSSLLLAGGSLVFGLGSWSWTTIASLGGLFTACFLFTHLFFLSGWMLPTLQWLHGNLNWTEQQQTASPSAAFRIRELHELVLLLEANKRYYGELARNSHDFLIHGGVQDAPPRSDIDAVGKSSQQFIRILRALEHQIGEIIQGHLFLDIPAELQNTRSGEALQAMMAEIRTILVKIRAEIKNISIASAKITALSQQGSHNATKETQAIESISSASHQVAANLREVMQDIRRQGDSLDQTFADIQEMRASTAQLNTSVEALAASAEATSRSISGIHAFMQEIEAHAQSLARIAETISTEANDGGHAVGEMIAGIQTIKQTVEEVATVIGRLGQESERIGEILAVINGVAEQTNLLALNASIIAAQAGEHGRGFAVVAGEIKELAERTRTSTKEIAAIIRSLQTEVDHGMAAMQSSLAAVGGGVALAQQSGNILQKIVGSIQGAQEMAATLAQATVTQTANSQQVKQATTQITQKLAELSRIALKQAQDSTNLTEMANILKEVTQHIEQSATIQLQGTDAIVQAIEELQDLVQRNAKIAHQLALSSDELGALESNLAENMGRFLVTRPQLPPGFDHRQSTIAFVYPEAPAFFTYIYQGIQQVSAANHFQVIALDSQSDPVFQVEYVNWLIQQPWLKGIILATVDELTGSHIVANITKRGIPLVAVDRSIKNAPLVVLSDNLQGGNSAVEMLHEKLPPQSTVVVCGSRSNIHSIFNRMEGFFQKAKLYNWHAVEIFASTMSVEQAKQDILEGLRLTPEVDGVFLTNEHASMGYLELLQEGKLPQRKILAVAYDLTPKIAVAIADGRLLGAIFQDPVKLGMTATQELLRLLQQPAESSAVKEVRVPVKKITSENIPSEFIT